MLVLASLLLGILFTPKIKETKCTEFVPLLLFGEFFSKWVENTTYKELLKIIKDNDVVYFKFDEYAVLPDAKQITCVLSAGVKTNSVFIIEEKNESTS